MSKNGKNRNTRSYAAPEELEQLLLLAFQHQERGKASEGAPPTSYPFPMDTARAPKG